MLSSVDIRLNNRHFTYSSFPEFGNIGIKQFSKNLSPVRLELGTSCMCHNLTGKN